mgnify:CR=1 FL=1
MGYYVKIIKSSVVIKKENYDAAYKALCELNNHNELKHGGRYPREEKDGPHEHVWFAWMPWNYPEVCKNLIDILECLGFEVTEDEHGICSLDYDCKTGNEEVFLQVLSNFIEPGGFINWEGEEGERWTNTYGDERTPYLHPGS